MEGHSDMNERKESLINVVIGGSGEEEIERSSIGDNITGGASVDEHGESSSKRKKPIRHNADQIQELELFFKKNSLPNKKVRLELATKLSMDINQLQLDLYENKTLKQENHKLRIENIVMKEALENSIHDNCKESIDENQIKIEHDQLEDEVKRLTAQAYKLSLFNKDVVQDKMVLLNLAMDALNELFRLYENDKPLWVSSLDGGGETLNIKEYAQLFTPLIGTKPEHFTTEATRASGTVADTSLALVNTLMDKRQWVEMFPCIVGKTYTTDVISTGMGGNKSGSLLLIKTELQIISDLVFVREVQFLRFCKKHAEGVWAIVDVSVDTIQEGLEESEIENCRRLPSGCILQDMPNGYCQVTWIEHMEYNENLVHNWYRPLIKSGLGFGAQRWMATLQRQYQFLKVMKSIIDPIVDLSGERGIRMLAQRMTHNFCAGVCATAHYWEIIQLANEENSKLMMRKNINDLGESTGVVLSATKTIWVPVKHQHLFKFLTNKKIRSLWDVLSNTCPMKRMINISKGQTVDSNISLFFPHGDDSGANRVILQDTCMDATGSLLVYATIDSQEINTVMKGGDSSCVTLFSNGITIVPDCFQDFSTTNNYNVISGEMNNGFGGGSLMTISFQMVGNIFPATTLSIELVKEANTLISHTIHKIKSALKCK
ncbi:homeobox-leucine zipper protein ANTHOCYANINLESS 2-like [Solanum stenotomum]|uniref:homeobox-leucine zipper protein ANTHOCYANINLESS 2-like n=1 Tax=Solanum stenotomum TaxID=172797 RepID=UPI0020D0839E|nr:homeobox-leucine zipper protein ANTHOCYANINLESS 2-like [Solanum stenotomum]